MGYATLLESTRPRAFVLVVLFLICTAMPVFGIGTSPTQDEKQSIDQPGFSAPDIEFFESRIRPLLVENCHDCHTGDEPSGNLNMASRQTMLAGGDSGPAIVPSKPEESLLIKVIHYGGIIQMPPDSKMPNESIALLEEWIRRGAAWLAEEDKAHADAELKLDDWTRREQHWAWQAPREYPVPVVEDKAWPRTDIDRFLKLPMESAGIAPSPDADRAMLLRRASWVLTGILPTADELKHFENNPDPDAFATEVDRLLASPRYGERFARHWLDLARYAETCGHEFDYVLPHAWQYRDYLIRAFNADIPYTQLLREHIAGDLLANPRTNPELGFNESIIGTGFWWMGEDTHGPVDVRGDEAGHIDNQIDVMAKTFLGMTVACARCHDHKFDAIKTNDFYALAGMLQSSRRQEAMLDPGGKIQIAFDERHKESARRNAAWIKWPVDYLSRLDRKHAESVLQTALGLSASRPKANGAVVRVQGESLKIPQQTSGVVEPQTIAATGDFAWEGDKQLWWKDAAIDDEVSFPLTIDAAGTMNITANLTRAGDYGIFSIWLDDQLLVENIDCYSTKLETFVSSLGTHEVAAGKHKLRVRATGTNENAIQRQMFGLDWIEFAPVIDESAPKQWEAELQAAFDATGITPDRMTLLVDSLPNLVRWLQWERPTRPESPSAGKKLFHDFSNGDEGWFRTGWAFAPVEQIEVYQLDRTLLPAGVVSSARFGPDLHGVLRSPTFEITDPQIHLLLRGGDIRVRVIVDGYVLDTSNALLFAGMTRDIGMSGEYRWETIADDLKTYVGHRAHLEIIDQGSGWVELSQIWFSKGSPPDGFLAPAPTADLIGLQPDAIVSTLLDVSREASAATEPFPVRLKNSKLRQWFLVREGRLLSRDLWENDPAALAAIVAKYKSPAPMLVQAMAEGTGENEFLFIRGNHKNLGPEVPRRSLEILNGKTPSDWSLVQGSGRLQLAQEMTQPDHPLVARVIVNRVWHHLFGRGLVEPTDNFGIMGSTPTHPELLDWLARDFVGHDWSIKRLTRQIMLSHAWQLTVSNDPTAIEKDPQNHLYARVEPRRMDGESIRDSMLAISGELKPGMFGEPVPVHLTEFMQGRGRPGKSGPLDGDGRRTIYLEVRRNFLHPMMLAFDTPIPFNTMGSRNNSNVPAQSLILMNDPFVVDQATKWAKRLVETVVDPDERLDQAFLAAVGRLPSTNERAECESMLDQLMHSKVERGPDPSTVERVPDPLNSLSLFDSSNSRMGQGPMLRPLSELQAWSALCHVLWNSKSFVFVW